MKTFERGVDYLQYRSRVFGHEELDFGGIFGQPNHALEFHADFLEHANRTGIIAVRNRHYSPETQDVSSVPQHGGSSLERVSSRSELRKKCEAEIDVVQRGTLQQAAHPYRDRPPFQLDQP